MSQPKIAVVGSVNMDVVVIMDRMPVAGETVSARDVRYVPGGKGANQAVGCTNLGAEVFMVGAVGRDVFGQDIAEQFRRIGLASDRILRHADLPTGIASIYLTPADNCIAVVPGANAACTAAYVDSHAQAVREADFLLVQLEIPLEAVERALRIAHEAGVPAILNPAPAQKLPASLLKLAKWITPNETEFAELSGLNPKTESEWEAALREYEAFAGPKAVVTRGEKGCSYLDENGSIRTCPAPPVQVVDTTGAGDALNAALAFALSSGLDIGKAAEFAVHAASLSVTRFGAQGGMPAYDEVAGFLQRQSR